MPDKRGIEAGTDDTEGNGRRPPGVDADDTEGNMPLRKVVTDGAEDDAEGNTLKFRPESALTDDDTEGRSGHARFVDDGVEDDTEGNVFRH